MTITRITSEHMIEASINELQPHPKNARKHPAKQIKRLAQNMEQGEVQGGAFHVAPHPDATYQELKGAQIFFAKVPEETFVLDRVFGKRTCVRLGPPPPMTTEEWLEMASRVRRHPNDRPTDSTISTQ